MKPASYIHSAFLPYYLDHLRFDVEGGDDASPVRAADFPPRYRKAFMGLAWGAQAALLKGLTMAGFGVFVFAQTFGAVLSGVVPEPLTMGVIASLALMLYSFRNGDANIHSVWLCGQNDVIGNTYVIPAAVGVFGTGLGWTDFVVAAMMAGLALSSGISVVRLARQELQISSSEGQGTVKCKSSSNSLPDQAPIEQLGTSKE